MPTTPSRDNIRVVSKGRFGAASGRTTAVAFGKATAVSVLITGICISEFLVSMLGAHAAQARLNLHAFDREALEIGGRIFRIEDLAVEEGLLAARGRGRDFRRRDGQLLRRLPPQVLAVHLANERLDVVASLVLAPADVLGEEPEIVALERIG